MFGTKSFSALYAKPSSWLKPMLEFEFLTSAGVILYFQCYQKNLRLMLNCYKPMTKGINEPLRELKRQLIEEGLLTFHDTEYKNVFGKDEENFRVSLYHGRDDTYFWEMVMTVMDRERAGRVNDLFVSCHVPLDRLADFRMDSRWEKLVTKERPHGNSLNEKFLLTALEKKDSQGRSGYKLALINNSRVPFLKVSEKTDAVKVSEDKRARPREPENLPRRKATAVKSRSLLELDGFYLPEDFEYPRTITLAVTPPLFAQPLTFRLPEGFPLGIYSAPAPLLEKPLPVCLPQPKHGDRYFLYRDGTPLSERGRKIRELIRDHGILGRTGRMMHQKLMHLEKLMNENTAITVLYPDLAREIADFNEAYIHHFYFSPATFQPLAERAVKDPSFPLEGMEELRSSQLNCLISHLPVLQSFKTMTRLNKMPIKLHYQLESCFDGLVENLHRAITETKGDSSEVLRAREFARKAHGNQKYGDKPYLHHLERVVEILRPFDNEDLQIIAYLHDVLEDTAITEAEIEQAFGEYIAHSVFLLSDESGRTRKIRKAATNGKLTGVRPPYLPVLIVKAADRLANLRACAADENRKKLDRYLEEREAFRRAVYRPRLCEELWEEIDQIYRANGGTEKEKPKSRSLSNLRSRDSLSRDERKVITIVEHYLGRSLRDPRYPHFHWAIYPERPSHCHPYTSLTGEDLKNCWYVFCPWYDGQDGMMLRSSRVVIVSKKTGEILYDGSALDER